MRQNHRPDLLLGNRLLIPACIKATIVDLTGDMVSLHSLSGLGKEKYYGFFKFHLTVFDSKLVIIVIIIKIVARILISNRFLPIKRVITTFFCGFSFSI